MGNRVTKKATKKRPAKTTRKKAPTASRKATKPKAKPPRISVRSFARELGVTHPAVLKAIKSGRLRESIARDVRGPFIADPERARKEWAEGAGKAPNSGNGNGQAAPSQDGTLVAMQTEAARERARKMRLENELKEGQLVRAEDVKKEAFEAARVTRDNVMNVPDRIAAELAAVHDAGEVHARLEAELAQALESVAEILAGG